jgi:hypothetical protein
MIQSFHSSVSVRSTTLLHRCVPVAVTTVSLNLEPGVLNTWLQRFAPRRT